MNPSVQRRKSNRRASRSDFYDLINSIGLLNEPIKNSIIKFKGKEYKIVDIDILCATASEPHHYEVLLK